MKIATRLVGLALISIFATGSLPPSSYAQELLTQDREDESRQIGTAAELIVEEALSLIESGQAKTAISNLRAALELSLSPYERSTAYQVLGSAYYEQEDYVQAISSFQNAINEAGLLPEESERLRLNIAQLMIANGQYKEGAAILEAYLKQGHPSKPEYVDMMVGACVQAKDYHCALPWAERWFKVANPKERKHYDLLNFLYNNLGMAQEQADHVKVMLQRFPEDTMLWESWASILSRTGREDEAFEVKKMLYLGGALTSEADLMQVVQYYSYYDMPFQAAQILEREMNAGRVTRDTKNMLHLSALYRQAREYKRAVPVLEQVADSAQSAEIYAQLGEGYYKIKQCEKAEVAFKKSMNLGYDKGKAWMLIGTCLYEESSRLERIDCDMTDAQIADVPRTVMRNRAVAAFTNVLTGSPHADDARKWRRFIKAEAQAVRNNCDQGCEIVVDLCYNDLANAYKARVFTGGKLVLNDPSCMEYKDAYEKIYIVKKTGG